MQALGSPQHTREGLDSNPHNVVQWLLDSQGHPGRLRMEAHLQGPFVSRAKPIAHFASPNPPRRPVLGNLFKEIVMRIKEEGHARHEFIWIQSRFDAPV